MFCVVSEGFSWHVVTELFTTDPLPPLQGANVTVLQEPPAQLQVRFVDSTHASDLYESDWNSVSGAQPVELELLM